jgi:GAF domain-containing protein
VATPNHPDSGIRTETLYEIIGAIAEGPTLDRVLHAVVDLLVRATACHACFVYLRDGDLLQLRAASPIFQHAVGCVFLGIDEGLTGWVARNRTPAFIREAAMQDPRMKYVPELEEERFQSMVAVPLSDRRGDVIGVVVLHTQAPREFGQDVLDLLVTVASLVVGAIDNARLYEQTRQQVTALSALNTLSARLAALTRREELFTTGCDGILKLLNAERCKLSLLDTNGAAIEVASSQCAEDVETDLLEHAPARGRLTARLLDGSQAFGLLRVTRSAPFSADDARLLETATNQLALALRTAELIQRLTAENRVQLLFDAIDRGHPREATVHARELGWVDGTPYTAVVARRQEAPNAQWDPAFATVVEQRLRLEYGPALIDHGGDRLRAIVPLGAATGPDDDLPGILCARLEPVGRRLGVGFGIGTCRTALADSRSALQEAGDAARVTVSLQRTGGAKAYHDLGPYRFLVELLDRPPLDPDHAAAFAALEDHDSRRNSHLLDTLDAYLSARGAVRATADTMFIHPNTLRQRLDRIETLTSLDLTREDLLSLELSLKLHRLHLGSSTTSG